MPVAPECLRAVRRFVFWSDGTQNASRANCESYRGHRFARSRDFVELNAMNRLNIISWCCSFDACAGLPTPVSLSLKVGRKCSEAARCSFSSSPLGLHLASAPPLRCRKYSGASAANHLQKSLNRFGAACRRGRCDSSSTGEHSLVVSQVRRP
jgi:hypothetical protein